jgi:putative transcriptional regulator
LEDSIAFSKGEKMSLVTVRVPAPPSPIGAKEVSEIRAKLSQGVFAAALNVSPKTVQGWEQGRREPSNASLRLLQIAREEPQVVLKTVRGKSSGYPATKKGRAVARRRKAHT